MKSVRHSRQSENSSLTLCSPSKTDPRTREDDTTAGAFFSVRGCLAVLAATFAFIAPVTAFAASEGSGGISPFVFQLSIFVLAIFVGYYVVWSVTPALHTPLMAVTNAISSVIVVGALLAVTVEAAGPLMASDNIYPKVFGFLALIMAAINIFGGFLVTSRMLAMYKKKDRAPK